MSDDHPHCVTDDNQECTDRQKCSSGFGWAKTCRHNGLRQRVWRRRAVILERRSARFAFLRSVALQVNGLLAVSAEFSIGREEYRVGTSTADAAGNLHISFLSCRFGPCGGLSSCSETTPQVALEQDGAALLGVV